MLLPAQGKEGSMLLTGEDDGGGAAPVGEQEQGQGQHRLQK